MSNNFQRSGFCTEFYSCHDHKGVGAFKEVGGPKSLSSRRVQTQKNEKAVNPFSYWGWSDELATINVLLQDIHLRPIL